ncbi:MAG TPA: type III pantothenate kinase [Firmicutes bacterium]|nr:type III pantothenate kinase [Bacillota bacterium]
MLIMVLDVGNTTTDIGLYKGDELSLRFHLSTNPLRPPAEYMALLQGLFAAHGINRGSVKGAALSSVVPPAEETIIETCRTYLNCVPLLISSRLDLGFKTLYEAPQMLGADRLANTAGALAKYGKPAIVVDLGTATKCEALSAAGEHLGGLIAPGVGISLDALAQRAAKLPRIDLRGAGDQVIARNTTDAIRSGVIHGTCSLVDGLVRKIKKEMGEPHPTVIATGGYAYILENRSAEVKIIDDRLTLDGIYFLYQRNKAATI